MTELERFESAMADKFGAVNVEKKQGVYVQPAMRLALFAWQTSRRAALDEAWEAVHGERLEDPSKNPDDVAYDIAVTDCEHVIRALAAGDKA